MAWGKGNQGICDTCGKTEAGHERQNLAIEFLRVMRWHHSKGVTVGGEPYESLLCPDCAGDTHKRIRTTVTIEQDALPFDWEALRVTPKGEGFASR